MILIDKSSVVIGMALAFIILREPVALKAVIGGALIAIGTPVIVLWHSICGYDAALVPPVKRQKNIPKEESEG